MPAFDTRHETVLFQSPLLLVGRFELSPRDEDFEEAGAIVTGNVVVFPQDPVFIQPEGGGRFVADSNTTVFHNLGTPYRRYRLGDFGDRATWFSFPPAVAREAVASLDPSASERELPFPFTHGCTDTSCYLVQKSLARHLECSDNVDALWMEEVGLRLLDRSLQRAFRMLKTAQRQPSNSNRPLAERTKHLLGETFRSNDSLSEMADRLNVSVYHLCRVFRSQSGLSIHRYRQLLRLKASLERVLSGSDRLTEVALELGFSSHSHFTSVFRLAFGFPPSHFRRDCSTTLLERLTTELHVV